MCRIYQIGGVKRGTTTEEKNPSEEEDGRVHPVSLEQVQDPWDC